MPVAEAELHLLQFGFGGFAVQVTAALHQRLVRFLLQFFAGSPCQNQPLPDRPVLSGSALDPPELDLAVVR